MDGSSNDPKEPQVLDPHALYELADDQPAAGELTRPVLVHVLDGFVDAGHGGRLAADHLSAVSPGPDRVLAEFDTDQLHDYRARRPPMVFATDHWESVQMPKVRLHQLHDSVGTPFLLLDGPEPDTQWERFVLAVQQLVERYDVRLTVGLHAIPMAVPHTRPLGLTAHATSPEVLPEPSPARGHRIEGQVQVPGYIGGLLEHRLGAQGHDAAGLAVHVPHYLGQTDYPDAAVTLLEALNQVSGLRVGTEGLTEAAAAVRAAVADQVAGQEEAVALVKALEEQYDAFAGAADRGSLLAGDATGLPTADELGAELERFLAREAQRRDEG